MSPPLVLDSAIDMSRWSDRARAEGLTTGFVPTMGNLHEGHLSLVRLARAGCDRVVVSIFVNPTQFGPGEDFANYPRTLKRDLQLLAAEGVTAVFIPTIESVYQAGDSTTVRVGWGEGMLCDRVRPGHFAGVLGVVARLLNIVRPDLAVFGQKDAQQALLIARLIRDLHFPVRMQLGPIVRESDGLAMSSRNSYLDAEERQRALGLSRALDAVGLALTEGERDPARLSDSGLSALKRAAMIPEYFQVLDPLTLRAPDTLGDGQVLVACAARVGKTRLIDNHVYDIRGDAVTESLLTVEWQ